MGRLVDDLLFLTRAEADSLRFETAPVALQNVLAELGRRECNDVLVEAGPTLAGRFLQLGLADELIVYIAPIVLGPEARAMALLPPLYRIEDVLRYTLRDLQRIGADVKLTLRP